MSHSQPRLRRRPTLAGKSSPVSYEVTTFFPGSWYTQDPLWVLQEWSFCLPQSCGIPVIKPHWPSKPDSLGAPPPVARPPGWELRTFTPVGGLWYNFSSLWVTHPAYMRFDFIVIVPLLLSLCCFFFVFGCRVSFLVGSSIFFVSGCSAVRCDFDGSVRSEFTSFYSAIFSPQVILNTLSFIFVFELLILWCTFWISGTVLGLLYVQWLEHNYFLYLSVSPFPNYVRQENISGLCHPIQEGCNSPGITFLLVVYT